MSTLTLARYRLPPFLHYTVRSALLTAKDFSFLVFTVALPVLVYVLFTNLYGSGVGDWAALMMVAMAAYGSVGAAMIGGTQLAVERRSGWFRQLSLTLLPPRSFLWARAGVVLLIALPALVLVFAAGYLIGGVRAPTLDWLASLVLLWIGLVPLALFGVVIGVWLRAQAVQQ